MFRRSKQNDSKKYDDEEEERLEELSHIFRDGIHVSDRKYHLKVYKDVFVGKEAVDYLVNEGFVSSRKEAVQLGRTLANRFHLFHHVANDHEFCDAHLFYRFRSSIFLPSQVRSMTLEQKAATFEQVISTKSHYYHLREYPNTFVGNEAVDCLVQSNLASDKKEAVALGQELAQKLNLFEHCCRQHDFEDKHLFYNFIPKRRRFFDIHDEFAVHARMNLDDDDDASVSSSVSSNRGTKYGLEEIAEALERDIEVKDRRWRLKTYRDVFVGRDAVTYLVSCGFAKSRRQAERLGREVASAFHLFEHVTDDHEFKDDYLFFRFTEKDERVTVSNESLSLQEISEAFEAGVKIKSHTYHLKSYKETFVGSRAVDFLVQSRIAHSRQHAVEIGRSLSDSFNLFQHCTGEHEFCDDRLFYRFTPPNERVLPTCESSDESELANAGTALRNGLILKNNRFQGKTYRQTFSGYQAVDFLVNSSLAESRRDAVQLGRRLATELDLFRSVTGHSFRDDHVLFCFNYDDIEGPWPSGLTDKSSSLSDKSMSLEMMAEAFQKGVKVRDNRYHLKVYKDVFVGTEAVDFLVGSNIAESRVDAVEIGRKLASEFSLFEHVTKDHLFEDRHFFYRFVGERRSWTMGEQITEPVAPILDLPIISDDKEWAERVRQFETKVAQKRFTDRSSRRLVNWASELRRRDPRYHLLSFFNELSRDGAENIDQVVNNKNHPRPLLRYMFRSSMFTIWRPTSFVSIRRMMLGEAVGKGLDIKGKSAKRGKNAGYVPVLQINENKHKRKIRMLPKTGTVRVFFGENGRKARRIAAEQLEAVAEEMLDIVNEARRVLDDEKADEAIRRDALDSMLLDMEDPTIRYIDDYAPTRYGLEIPGRLFWEAYFVRQDCSPKLGSQYDSGRPSQPAFQDMNLASLQKKAEAGRPQPVVLQTADPSTPMNHFGLLMAYEEHGQVLPVVSDFDCLLIGTRGVTYQEPLPPAQLSLLNWCLSAIERILGSPPGPDSWTNRWLEVLSEASASGFSPDIPRYGFGDPKSYSIIESLVTSFQMGDGAVRHGAECFNYYFPQELDNEFLIISADIPGALPWQYKDANGLQNFLSEKIDEGYTFPLNVKWVLCDSGGWKDIYSKLMASAKKNVPESLDVWFPQEIREKIEAIHRRHPLGFQRQRAEMAESILESSTALMDLALHKLQRPKPSSSVLVTK